VTERLLLWRETRTLAQLLWRRRLRVLFVVLAAGLISVGLKGCNTPLLEQDEVVSARGPVQAQVAARLDLTALPVLGQVHDADCNPGQDNLTVREDYEFFCYTREVRVVDLGQADLAAALDAADRAVSTVCGKQVRRLSDPARATGKDEEPPRAAQLRCGDVTLDVLVAAPNDPGLKSSFLFHAPYQPRQTTVPEPPGLDAAKRAGSGYVLCLLGRQEFYRKMR